MEKKSESKKKGKAVKKEPMEVTFQRIKERDGRLSKLGEWLLSGKTTGFVLEDRNMRYVMK